MHPPNSKKSVVLKTCLVFCLLIAQSTIQAQARAAENADFISTVLNARVIELNFIWDKNAPVVKNPPYSLALHTAHSDWKIPGGVGFAMDMMFFSGQHGAPTIDAIGHVSDNGKLYGGLDADANTGSAGLKVLGIETYPHEKFVNRAVLLDVARFKGVAALAADYEISADDLAATEKAQGVKINEGDAVLIRTGYGQYFDSDREKYLGPRPGPGKSAAEWLAAKHIFLAGCDQLSFEIFPAKKRFPAHRILVADNGIYIVEQLNLEELASLLAEREDYAFVLVLNPLRFKGATASPLNAFALLP